MGGGRIHPYFPCVPYKTTKRVSQWQRVCVTSTGMPKTLPPFSKLSCPIPNQPLLHMVQHVADRVAPFSGCQYAAPPPLKFVNTLLSPPSSNSLPYVNES